MTLRPCPDTVMVTGLFAAIFVVFFASPVQRVTDSKYTMLLSEQLRTNHSFELDRFFWPYVDSTGYPGTGDDRARATVTRPRHVRETNGHLYYHYPHGSAVLAIPFSAAGRALGVSAIDASGRYDFEADRRLQRVAASFYTAAAVALFFLTARLCLPARWSLLVALSGGLATPLWSTASRSLQSHTCDVALLSLAVYALMRSEGRCVRSCWPRSSPGASSCARQPRCTSRRWPCS